MIDQNRLLLYQRDIGDASVFLGQFNQISTEVKRCVRDVKAFLEMTQDAIVRFYRLQFSGVHDINIQLLQNLLTSIVLKDDLYIFMQCLYSLQYKNEIQALNELFQSEHNNILPKLSMESLNIK